MFKKQGRYKIYSVRRAGKSALPKSAVLLSVLCFTVIISVVIATISACGDGRNTVAWSSATAHTEISSTVASKEEEYVVSSSIAKTETSTSSAPVSSVVSNTPTSSQAPTTQTPTAANNYGLPFDVYAAAEKWTYVVDKTKPVPLQPAVDNSFFAEAMFVGDSITTGIDLYGIVNNAPVIAYTGINTNTVLERKVIKSSSGKLTFLQAMKKHNPKHIYIMLGINGINFQSKTKFISGYRSFVAAVKAQHPNAVIYLQSILPVTAKKSSGNFANSNIDSYNTAVAALATELNVYYLNVAESFKDANGNMPSKASSDGIHFGTGYYKRWIEYLKRHTVYTGEIPVESSSTPSTTTSSAPAVSSNVTTSQNTTTSEATTTSTAPAPSPSTSTSSEGESSRLVDIPSVSRPPKDSSSIATTEQTN